MAPSFSHLSLKDIVMLALWLFETARLIYRRWRRSLAPNWPLTNGSIEDVEVIAGQNQNVNLRYSYSVAGEWYSGELIASFDDSKQALNFVHRAKGTRISVSVSPGNPAESFVIPEQLAAAKTGLLAGNVETAPPTLAEPALPLTVRLIACLLLAATAGLLVAFFTLHIAALRGRLLLNQDELTTIIVAGIVAFIAVLGLDTWRSRKESLSRRLPVLRWPGYFFWLLTGFYIFAAEFYPDLHSPLFNRQVLCSIAELICWGMFTSLYFVLTTRKFPESVEPALHAEAGT
jgi:hypothetical protein